LRHAATRRARQSADARVHAIAGIRHRVRLVVAVAAPDQAIPGREPAAPAPRRPIRKIRGEVDAEPLAARGGPAAPGPAHEARIHRARWRAGGARGAAAHDHPREVRAVPLAVVGEARVMLLAGRSGAKKGAGALGPIRALATRSVAGAPEAEGRQRGAGDGARAHDDVSSARTGVPANAQLAHVGAGRARVPGRRGP